MKVQIKSYKTLCGSNAFDEGILAHIRGSSFKKLLEPDYQQYIPAGLGRRISKVVKMGVATAIAANNGITTGGIIVGTGTGCCSNTIDFIKEYYGNYTDSLSPNSFIQSTDNTIAGLIAIILQNHHYNITYIQNGLTFENALMDAMMLSNEKKEPVLVGGVDEKLDIFEFGEGDIRNGLNTSYFLGEGSTFLVLDAEKDGNRITIDACGINTDKSLDVEEKSNLFISYHQLEPPDLILYGNSFINKTAEYPNKSMRTFNYSQVSGIYPTNVGFGIQLAAELLSNNELADQNGLKAKRILVVNNFNDYHIGFTYLSK